MSGELDYDVWCRRQEKYTPRQINIKKRKKEEIINGILKGYVIDDTSRQIMILNRESQKKARNNRMNPCSMDEYPCDTPNCYGYNSTGFQIARDDHSHRGLQYPVCELKQSDDLRTKLEKLVDRYE